MGILNVTPDSFSDGGLYFDLEDAVRHAQQMVEAGADILDIGGESTRPGADPVPEAEEVRRVASAVERLRAEGITTPLSLDTTKAAVARAGIEAGADLVNDISGATFDPAMLSTVTELGVPLCLMHLPIRPQEMGWSKSGGTMDPETDVVEAVISFLVERITAAEAAGISRENLLIDPGFGFGKSAAQNLELLRRLPEIQERLHHLPLLLGTSRKSTIARVLGPDAERVDPDRTAGTAATIAAAITGGATDIVRVHDVAFMARVTRMTDAIVRQTLSPSAHGTPSARAASLV